MGQQSGRLLSINVVAVLLMAYGQKYNDDQYKYLDDSRLIAGQRFYQRNRDMSTLVAVGFYVLNIVDANIDAHLMQFNVDNKLTFRPHLEPDIIDANLNFGLTLNIKL